MESPYTHDSTLEALRDQALPLFFIWLDPTTSSTMAAEARRTAP
ncbi:MAG TPA: hypothetical protein VF006_34040 [Longimicrobium sp.]